MVSEASGSTGTTQEPYTYFNHQQQPEPRGRAPRSNRRRAIKRPDAEEDGALGRRKAFDASTRVTHACTEAAALPTSEKKHCMQMMCCAPQARKICTKKLKVVPK